MATHVLTSTILQENSAFLKNPRAKKAKCTDIVAHAAMYPANKLDKIVWDYPRHMHLCPLCRRKGENVTLEDQGAESALNPDTAVDQGIASPDVSEKKEYFI